MAAHPHEIHTTRSIPLQQAALFLDLDGTLAEFADTPGAVGPLAARTDLLRRAGEALNGRLAVVSGRALDEIDRIVEGAAACAAGVHGLQRRSASGVVLSASPHPALPDAEAQLRAFAAERPGLLVEPKSLSVAVHYRNAPDQEVAVRRRVRDLAAGMGLAIQEGEFVVELKTPGADKGCAVQAFMAEPPFRGATPIFVGDDITDEAAFAEAQSLGGLGVLVGRRSHTAAVARLRDVSEVMAWLDRSLDTGAFRLEAAA